MIVEIQCLPSPAGVEGDRYRHIEAAIRVVQESGLQFEVSPLGTTVEGEPDTVWALVRRVHEAPLLSGSASIVTVVKVAQAREDVAQPTMSGLTAKYR
ncbi:MAG: thiamine-binding protein [Gemmataceae bacterium]|nr:thiamine-binding protein [Gemmataceae bacterium]